MKASKAITRRSFLRQSVAAAGICMVGCNGLSNRSNAKMAQRPNIIYIMSDDHDRAAISAYGSKINKTPNLDTIGNEGMLFENCFCTNSICAPSRAVMLTGKYSHINGKVDNKVVFDGDQPTAAKYFRACGYQTAMIGKWHLRSDPQGFDYWNILPGQGNYYNPDFIEMGVKKRYDGYVTDITTDITLDWLNGIDSDKPFFLMYQHKAPHRPWMPGPKYLTMYDDVTIPEPATLFDDYEGRGTAAKTQEMTIAEHMFPAYDLKLADSGNLSGQDKGMSRRILGRMTAEQRKAWDKAYGPKNAKFYADKLEGKELVRWKYQRYIKDYLRCIASVDENVGRVLGWLQENGLAENTIVIYTSDQGFYLGDHGWFDKRFMYEQSLSMPLMVRYPKAIKAGIRSDELVMNLDFAATLLDYAGMQKPADMQGESFRKILEDEKCDWRKSVYYHYYEYPAEHQVRRHYGVRTDRYKLIHFYYDIDEWELYDLKEDPDEMKNVYDEPKYRKVRQGLHAELEKLRRKYGDSDELNKMYLENYLKRRKK
jgi:arylsulfatase A-like enzyme